MSVEECSSESIKALTTASGLPNCMYDNKIFTWEKRQSRSKFHYGKIGMTSDSKI